MNNFNFEIVITGSIRLPMYDDHPHVATYESDGYTRSFLYEGSLSDAMRFAEAKCAETLTVELEDMTCDCHDEAVCDCTSYEPEPEDILRPYLVEITSLIHKNTVVGGEPKGKKINWIIPEVRIDHEAIQSKCDALQKEACEESRWDNFDTARHLRFKATLEMLKSADYWKYIFNAS